MEHFDIACPKCEINIHVPFMRELEAKAIEEADLAEITARQEIGMLKGWLRSVSLFGLFKFWLKRKEKEDGANG